MTDNESLARLSALVCLVLPVAAFAEELPNPAAVFCEAADGTYRVEKEVNGERGLCVLADGREIDAWQYFRDHQKASARPEGPSAKTKHADGASMSQRKLAGGWTRQETVTDDARAALSWVLARMNTAAGLRAIREVRTQVVAGLNDAIEFELDNDEVWHTIVYRDLDDSLHMTEPAKPGPLSHRYERSD